MAALFEDPGAIRRSFLESKRVSPGSTPESAIIAASANLGTGLGYSLGRLFGRDIPEVHRAEAKQEAMNAVLDSTDADGNKYQFGTEGFFQNMALKLTEYGFPNEAYQANLLYRDLATKRVAAEATKEANRISQTRLNIDLSKERSRMLKAVSKDERELGLEQLEVLADNSIKRDSKNNTVKEYLKDLGPNEKSSIVQDAVVRSRRTGVSVSEAMETIALEQLEKGRQDRWTTYGSKYVSEEDPITNAELGLPERVGTDTETQAAAETPTFNINEHQTSDEPEDLNRYRPDVPVKKRQLNSYNEKEIDNVVLELSGANDISLQMENVRLGGAGLAERSQLKNQRNKMIKEFKESIPEFKAIENYKKQIRAEVRQRVPSKGAAGKLKFEKALKEYMNTPEVKNKMKSLEEALLFKINEKLDPPKTQLFLQ
tara:strand:+ start:1960 stop:3246 length:1287 start_codon:yes stop_codon:yes gene_type:complete